VTATSPGAGQELLGLVMSANEKAARALKRQIRRAPIEDKVSIASSLGYPADMPTDALDMVLLAHAKHQQQLCAAAPGAAPVGVPSGPASAPPGGIISSAPGKGGAPRGRAGAGEHAADGGVAECEGLRAALRDAQARLRAAADDRAALADELRKCRAERDRLRDEARAGGGNDAVGSASLPPAPAPAEALEDHVRDLEQERIVLRARVSSAARRNEQLETQVSALQAQLGELARAPRTPPRAHPHAVGAMWDAAALAGLAPPAARSPPGQPPRSPGLWAAPCSPPAVLAVPTQQALPLEEARRLVDDVTVASRTAQWVREHSLARAGAACEYLHLHDGASCAETSEGGGDASSSSGSSSQGLSLGATESDEPCARPHQHAPPHAAYNAHGGARPRPPAPAPALHHYYGGWAGDAAAPERELRDGGGPGGRAAAAARAARQQAADGAPGRAAWRPKPVAIRGIHASGGGGAGGYADIIGKLLGGTGPSAGMRAGLSQASPGAVVSFEP
jgi:hypothetical protein